MTKQEFLAQLRKALPRQDAEERLTFYSEIIDDYMEEGLSEADAVAKIGPIDEIISQVPVEKTPKRRLKVWEIILLVLGSPIWLSLYVVLWAAVICLWAGFASLAACALGGVVGGTYFIISGNPLQGIATIGAALVCAGLAIFLFYGCMAATKGTVLLTKKIVLTITRRKHNG